MATPNNLPPGLWPTRDPYANAVLDAMAPDARIDDEDQWTKVCDHFRIFTNVRTTAMPTPAGAVNLLDLWDRS